MAVIQQRLLYQRRCHAPSCAALFFICRSCYRGQRYCSEPCRQTARREQRRGANRRHQQSPEGRLDHADRQRQYRLRLALPVTDQGSAKPSGSGSISQLHPNPAGPGPRGVCCIVCGHRGRFIEQRE